MISPQFIVFCYVNWAFSKDPLGNFFKVKLSSYNFIFAVIHLWTVWLAMVPHIITDRRSAATGSKLNSAVLAIIIIIIRCVKYLELMEKKECHNFNITT